MSEGGSKGCVFLIYSVDRDIDGYYAGTLAINPSIIGMSWGRCNSLHVSPFN